ncbi:putative ubiquitin domain protein [Cladophialophora carrionii]|uniref:Putative ubiquitin domain protein n=1 Tax=Cladophialophora carrionii TaxID=86049 RepID=A0A1C1CU59_9EURO|nr:putative ubiquitin domain protein [Cladophialophora carrionii]
MGCCASRPTHDDDVAQAGRPSVSPPTRHTAQAITSQTAINGTADDGRSRDLSVHQSHTSRSALSTPRQSVQNAQSQPGRQPSLADPYDLPLEPPKPWKSKKRTWTRSQLLRERYEFFETRVTGHKEVWNGLKQAIECLREGDLADAQGILSAMSVTLPTGKLEDGAYDEHGNLYKIPQAVISDPDDVVEDMNDIDSQTVTGASDLDAIAAKLEATDPGAGDPLSQGKQTSAAEAKAKAVKGKTAVRDAVKVRCRLSDRGSPECDVTVVLGRSERVALLADRIGVERDIPSRARLRFAYLGKTLDGTKTLEEQGFREGDVIQVLVVGNWK